jgi:hypothetical protein
MLSSFAGQSSVYGGVVGPVLHRALEGALKHGTNLQFGRSSCCGSRPGGVLQPTSNGIAGGLSTSTMSMSGYCKLFSSIVASTIWREANETRLLWITMLALADRDGIVEGAVPGLADMARLSVEATRNALAKLESPDPDSRSQEFEGRRIQKVFGGWKILNYQRYRAKCDKEDAYRKHVIRQQRYRESSTLTLVDAAGDGDGGGAGDVLGKKGSVREGKPADFEAVKSYAAEIELPAIEAEKFFDHFESNGWKQGGRTAMKDWRAALRNWKRNVTNFSVPHVNGVRKTPADIRTVIEAKHAQLVELRNKHRSEVAMGTVWNDENARQQAIKLGQEIKTLRNQLGNYYA